MEKNHRLLLEAQIWNHFGKKSKNTHEVDEAGTVGPTNLDTHPRGTLQACTGDLFEDIHYRNSDCSGPQLWVHQFMRTWYRGINTLISQYVNPKRGLWGEIWSGRRYEDYKAMYESAETVIHGYMKSQKHKFKSISRNVHFSIVGRKQILILALRFTCLDKSLTHTRP